MLCCQPWSRISKSSCSCARDETHKAHHAVSTFRGYRVKKSRLGSCSHARAHAARPRRGHKPGSMPLLPRVLTRTSPSSPGSSSPSTDRRLGHARATSRAICPPSATTRRSPTSSNRACTVPRCRRLELSGHSLDHAGGRRRPLRVLPTDQPNAPAPTTRRDRPDAR
jgi:hypothetical protein